MDNKFSFMSLFITRKCNLACSYCNLPDPNLYTMDGDEWIKVIDKVAPHTQFFNLIGGEPTMHPDLDIIVEHLNGIDAAYSMVTNSTQSYSYYQYLLIHRRLQSLGVSIDTMDPYGNDSVMRKSKAGIGLIKYIRRETTYNGNLIISAVAKNLVEFKSLVKFAKEHQCQIALALQQSSDDENMLNSNNPDNKLPNESGVTALLKYIIFYYYQLPLLDPSEYFVAMLDRLMRKKGLWHCTKGLTPAIDSNGDLWNCFDYKGGNPINVLDDRFPDETTFEKMNMIVKHGVKACPGCQWNCPYVSELVADGIVKMDFS